MHGRYRNPGNGYRSNSMGMGSVAAASRISPEGSNRGHGAYNSQYRTYNRGFGRGQPKPVQPPQPPPMRRGDIFMEAGRLATEYLVANGLLPQNVLSGKWQNGSLKHQAGDNQGFSPLEGENLHLPAEGRTSALARLGTVVPDAGPGGRKLPEEFNSAGLRSYTRGRRRMGPFRNYSPDGGREVGRSFSWSNKASPEMEGDDDHFSGNQEERQLGNEVGGAMQKSQSNEIASKSDVADSSDSSVKYQFRDDIVSKASSSSSGTNLSREADKDVTNNSTDLKTANAGPVEVLDGTSNNESERQHMVDDEAIQPCASEVNSLSRNNNDLLSLCRFARVPTKTRSSLTVKALKVEQVPITEDDKDTGLTGISGVPTEDVDDSSCGVQSNKVPSPKSLDSDVLKLQSVASAESAGELGSRCTIEQGKCTRSKSFPETSFMGARESSEEPSGFRRSSSTVLERGEKRARPHIDCIEGPKKPRDWLPQVITQGDDRFPLSNWREVQPTMQEERTTLAEEVIMAIDQERSVDMTLFPKAGTETGIDFSEEKQIFPGSFKICDLNLMEASDVNENHETDQNFIFPSITISKKEVPVIDIDLSISNNFNMPDKYGKHGADSKEVEVIDLENDTVQEVAAFNNSERRPQSEFTGMGNFPNHSQNTNDIPDVQDGYGYMISELLGTDVSNCPSVPVDMNSLHNEMGLHNGEGILGDDESIYMSLGEIPISMPEL